MTIQVSTTDTRTAKALELLSGADKWLKITSKLDGKRYYAVPSSDGKHVYWVRPDSCTCPDAAHRAITCKHQIAAGLWVAKVNAERQQPKRRAPRPAAPAPECGGCNQEQNRKRIGGRRLSQAERSAHTCGRSSEFTSAASIGGSITTELDRARMKAQAAKYREMYGSDDD